MLRQLRLRLQDSLPKKNSKKQRKQKPKDRDLLTSKPQPKRLKNLGWRLRKQRESGWPKRLRD